MSDKPTIRGLIGNALRDALEAAADADDDGRASRTGSVTDGRRRAEYGITVGTLRPGEVPSDAGDSSRAATLETTDTEYATSVRHADEGVVVTADLPGIDPAGLAAGVTDNSRTLLIADDDRLLTRVELPDGEFAVDGASFNNAVLEVYLHPAGDNGQ
ncbi:gas vesicle protein GvpH [Halococcus sp. PRR34]|uniref:gas vesicle protein GvpH n=1 Tax=Halococcus sp. PRR34 TaxID=3020830 RepID=UPI00235FECFE|nr:gas vesicle protein GvpH [Halococcus sp. PRR34]